MDALSSWPRCWPRLGARGRQCLLGCGQTAGRLLPAPAPSGPRPRLPSGWGISASREPRPTPGSPCSIWGQNPGPQSHEGPGASPRGERLPTRSRPSVVRSKRPWRHRPPSPPLREWGNQPHTRPRTPRGRQTPGNGGVCSERESRCGAAPEPTGDAALDTCSILSPACPQGPAPRNPAPCAGSCPPRLSSPGRGDFRDPLGSWSRLLQGAGGKPRSRDARDIPQAAAASSD